MHMVVDVNEMLISTERRLEYESFKVMLPVWQVENFQNPHTPLVASSLFLKKYVTA